MIRAWFIGMYTQLDGASPAEVIRDGRLKEALAAATYKVHAESGGMFRHSSPISSSSGSLWIPRSPPGICCRSIETNSSPRRGEGPRGIQIKVQLTATVRLTSTTAANTRLSEERAASRRREASGSRGR